MLQFEGDSGETSACFICPDEDLSQVTIRKLEDQLFSHEFRSSHVFSWRYFSADKFFMSLDKPGHLSYALSEIRTMKRREIKPIPSDVWKKSFEVAKVEGNCVYLASIRKGLMNPRLSRIQSTLLTPVGKSKLSLHKSGSGSKKSILRVTSEKIKRGLALRGCKNSPKQLDASLFCEWPINRKGSREKSGKIEARIDKELFTEKLKSNKEFVPKNFNSNAKYFGPYFKSVKKEQRLIFGGVKCVKCDYHVNADKFQCIENMGKKSEKFLRFKHFFSGKKCPGNPLLKKAKKCKVNMKKLNTYFKRKPKPP